MIIKDEVYLVYDKYGYTGRSFNNLLSAKRCVAGLKVHDTMWDKEYKIYNVKEIHQVVTL